RVSRTCLRTCPVRPIPEWIMRPTAPARRNQCLPPRGWWTPSHMVCRRRRPARAAPRTTKEVISMRTLETLSGGEWVRTGEWIDAHAPADVRPPLARTPALPAKDVTRAYDHAERGFAVWKRTSPFERARVFTEAARLIRERAGEIAADVTAENGKTLA